LADLGKLVLSTNNRNQISSIQLIFVDYTTGYEATYIPSSSIPIYGTGLDNLHAAMAEPVKIINSVSITRI